MCDENVIIMENTRKTHLLLNTTHQLVLDGLSKWDKVYTSRCPRCYNIFASKTDRKYCSKKCQYQREEDQ